VSSASRERWALFACAVCATAWWHWPFTAGDKTGWGDWQYFHHMWEAGRVAVERHGEWPTWDPFHCGGVTLWSNPQAQVYSPLFALSFLFGTTFALKLHVWVHAVVGFAGAYLFARSEGRLSRIASMTTAICFGGAGYFAWHLAGGHSAFAPFYFIPALLLCWRRAEKDLRWSVGVAALMAMTLLDGGVYPFPYFALLLGLDALTRLRPKRILGVVRAGVVSAVLAGLLGAVRLIPILARLEATPRNTPILDGIGATQVLQTLLHQEAPPGWVSHYGWPEYGAYVGHAVLLLAAISVPWALRRRPSWVAFAALFGAMAMGKEGVVWPLLHRLPVFDSLRVPSRFLVVVSFYLALLAGLAVHRMSVRSRRLGYPLDRRRAPAIAVLALLAAGVPMLAVNGDTIDRWTFPPIQMDEPAEHFHLSTRPYIPEYAQFPQANVGTRRCYDPMNVRVAPGLVSGDRPQVRIRPTAGAQLHREGRTTSTVWADATLGAGAQLRFNQNFAPGWRSDLGRVDEEQPMLTVVDLPEGRHRVTVRYEAPGAGRALQLFALGATLSILLLLGMTWWRRRRAKNA